MRDEAKKSMVGYMVMERLEVKKNTDTKVLRVCQTVPEDSDNEEQEPVVKSPEATDPEGKKSCSKTSTVI